LAVARGAPFFSWKQQHARFLGARRAPASGTRHGAVLLAICTLADYPYRLAGRGPRPRA
jgi:hypothetical protein